VAPGEILRPGSYAAAARWFAARHGITVAQARSDPRFRGVWALKNRGREMGGRYNRRNVLDAYRALGMVDRQPEGNWGYSPAFLAWLFGGGADIEGGQDVLNG
jgi:hypothetical protein